VTVNLIAPGFITTDMTSSLPEEVQNGIKQMIPLGHFGSPKDVATAAQFLCSDAAAYITGQVLMVDGGMAM
jgi:3-oxoacyl-[acyl-carrier protein] reductase